MGACLLFNDHDELPVHPPGAVMAMMVPPMMAVQMMPPRPELADAARPVIGVDHAADPTWPVVDRRIVARPVIAVVARAAVVRPEAGVSMAEVSMAEVTVTDEARAAVELTMMEHRPATDMADATISASVERRAETAAAKSPAMMKPAAVETPTAMMTATAAADVAGAHLDQALGRRVVRSRLVGSRRARARRRQRLRTRRSRDRHRQCRDRRDGEQADPACQSGRMRSTWCDCHRVCGHRRLPGAVTRRVDELDSLSLPHQS